MRNLNKKSKSVLVGQRWGKLNFLFQLWDFPLLHETVTARFNWIYFYVWFFLPHDWLFFFFRKRITDLKIMRGQCKLLHCINKCFPVFFKKRKKIPKHQIFLWFYLFVNIDFIGIHCKTNKLFGFYKNFTHAVIFLLPISFFIAQTYSMMMIVIRIFYFTQISHSKKKKKIHSWEAARKWEIEKRIKLRKKS